MKALETFASTHTYRGAPSQPTRGTYLGDPMSGSTNFVTVNNLNNTAYGQLGIYNPPNGPHPWGYALFTTRGVVRNEILYVASTGALKLSTSFQTANGDGGDIVGAQTSDERLKNIDSEFAYGLSDVLKLKPIAFRFKSDDKSERKLGFGAQSTLPIIPEAVYDTLKCIDGYEKDEDSDEDNAVKPCSDDKDTTLGMEYVQLIPVLTKAIQEQQAIIEDLKNRIDTLENK